MGGVLMRDALAAQDGKLEWWRVREHCGLCVIDLYLEGEGEAQKYLCGIPDLVPGYT